MERHFHEELEHMKNRLLEMGTVVEKAIKLAMESLVNRDDALANQVIEEDDVINRLEIEIDELCLKLLALQQPVAVDLRFIMSAMKINNDLERMGDHAVNIAKLALLLNREVQLKPLIDLPRMSKVSKSMLRDGLQSFVDSNVDLAREICRRDDEVDGLDDQIARELLTYMMDDPKTIHRAMNLMLISKNIERIADLSTNIAEEVIFIVKAKTIKHNTNGDRVEDVRSRS